MLRLWASAWIVAVGAFGAEPLTAQVTLRHNFPDERATRSVVKVQTRQVLTLNHEKFEAGSEQEMVINTKNGIRDKDGELRQRVRIDSLKAKLTMPGGVVLEFDSRNPGAASSGTKYDMFLDLIKAQAAASWTIARGPDNRAKSVDGKDRILESLDQTRRELVKRQVDPNYLRDQANLELEIVPEKPLNVGDSWEVTNTLRLDAGQSLRMKNAYTYRGEVDRENRKLHQIDVQLREVTYIVDSSESALRLKSSRLQPSTLQGVLYFDAEQGMVVESHEKFQITGDILVDLQGNALSGSIDLTLGTSLLIQP